MQGNNYKTRIIYPPHEGENKKVLRKDTTKTARGSGTIKSKKMKSKKEGLILTYRSKLRGIRPRRE